MGSLLSPFIANLFIEEFENKALDQAPQKRRIWYKYVDDTFTVLKKDYVESFKT